MKILWVLALILLSIVVIEACLPQCRSCQCSGKCPGKAVCSGSGSYCHCTDLNPNLLGSPDFLLEQDPKNQKIMSYFQTTDDYLYAKLIHNMCLTLKNTTRPLVLYLAEFEQPVEIFCTEDNELRVKSFRTLVNCVWQGVSYAPGSCVRNGDNTSIYCCKTGGWRPCGFECTGCNNDC